MKQIIALTFMLFISGVVYAQPSCKEAKPNTVYNGRLAYLGENHWLTLVDKRLLEFQGDKLVSTVSSQDYLNLSCGQGGEVIATSKNKVMRWEKGRLQDLNLKFKGDAIRSDGETVYSTVDTAIGFALYTNKKGVSTKITEQKGFSGAMADGYFIWSNYNTGHTFVLRNGHVVKKIQFPKGAQFNTVFDYASCQGQGLFSENDNYLVQSRYGVQKRSIDSIIQNIDYPQNCGNYMFLLNDKTYTNGKLWSLKPGKSLTFSEVPTACGVDHFTLNGDGSLFYRCGKQFHYLNQKLTGNTLVGDAPKLQLTGNASDQWLSTEQDGTLYSYLPDVKAKESQTACFVRLSYNRLVDLGCY